jgi:hypothetical protein
MRKATLFALLTLVLAFTASADERHQSYISYDDGGTIVRSGDREVEATRNLPIYPGDEVVTARRGRAEVSLSDGNIIGIDRATALRLQSILDSYEGDSNETVALLRYGKVAIHRTDIGREHVRLDTDQASYVATYEAVYSVESDSRGRDRVTVFDGSVEVRTPQRSTRLRRGETASVDSEGVYDLIADRGYAADDFENWFLKRAERFGTYEAKYTDRRVGYWSDDLDSHGRWVFVTGIGWSWRPFVTVGWRPYYNGYWYTSRWGCLTWVSYDPWGWAPWHYGRWAFDGGYGWVWVPGYNYSPAWVYWMYGPGYVGWAPAGWWDCHRPYYSWAYNPYRRGHDFGFGFHGRIRVNDVDLRPWTFVDGNTLFTNRIDRAALTTDAIKGRLGRNSNGLATVSGSPARFTREEFRDPAEAIRRRGLGGDNSGATGPNTDLTSFIRRDADLGAQVKDRIVRSRPSEGAVAAQAPGRTIGGASSIPTTGGTPRGIDRGSGSSITVQPADAATRRRDPVVIVGRDRAADGENGSNDTSERGTGSSSTPSSVPSWRDRVNRGGSGDEGSTTNSQPRNTPSPITIPRGDDTWRNRRGTDSDDSSSAPSTRSGDSTRGSGDVPARVIDRIGGARVVPRDRGEDRGSSGSARRGDSGGSDRPSRSSGSVDRGSRDSGSSRSSGSSTRSSGNSGSSGSSRSSGSSSGGSSTRSSGNSGSSGSSSSGGGGRIKRDQ